MRFRIQFGSDAFAEFHAAGDEEALTRAARTSYGSTHGGSLYEVIGPNDLRFVGKATIDVERQKTTVGDLQEQLGELGASIDKLVSELKQKSDALKTLARRIMMEDAACSCSDGGHCAFCLASQVAQ